MFLLSLFLGTFGACWFYIEKRKNGFIRLGITLPLVITISILGVIISVSNLRMSIDTEIIDNTIFLVEKMNTAITILSSIVATINIVEILYVIFNKNLKDSYGFILSW
ncbi:hypothetical protein MCSF7_01446 [Mycoplasmopsis columbina SF7]|uniref:Uncharacterized protein n=1 Tax=Mycoplasmopsis columbina SF7 TaxID=1037410 RepID=F9UK78_9BACT|nr:hypothetical protein [Mycoplasmopsis columbina]EGV00083.1 hypothetical protein MCSF7_01446 [Mycoplasmopsis columbina SF7]